MGKPSRLGAVALALGVMVGLFAPACGGTGTAEPAPIKVGSLVPVSVEAAGQWVAGARAAAREVNSRGGIHGRRIEIENCDDHRDPNLAEACARQLVRDGVVATAGSLTSLSMVEAPVLDQAGIPEVGSEAVNPEDTSLPTAFPLDGGIVTQVIGQVFGAKRRGLHSLYIVSLDTPAGQLAISFASMAARAAGIQVVGAAFAPAATADFTPYVRAAMQAHADVVWPALFPPWFSQLLTASKVAGATFLTCYPYGAVAPRDVEELGGSRGPTEGSIQFGALPPVGASDRFPALLTFKADMDAELAAGDADAAPGLRSGGPLAAWLSVEVIARILATLPRLDAAALLSALRTQPTVDTLGLTPTWTPGHTGPKPFPRVTNPFGYLITQRNGVDVLADTQPFNTALALGATH
jgi:branched-chain amino acid transport system substrate-binding protein